MAVVKFSALVESVSGRVGQDLIFSNWKGKGVVRRVPTTNPNPGTPSQVKLRQALTELVQRWKNNLTPLQKALWDQAAEESGGTIPQLTEGATTQKGLSDFPSPADGGNVSGINLFTRVNLRRAQFGDIREGPNLGVLNPVTGATDIEGGVVHRIDDAPPSTMFEGPAAPTGITLEYDDATGELTLGGNAPTTYGPPSIGVPSGDVIEGQNGVVELYIRVGDPRVNRLYTLAGVAPLGTITPVDLTDYVANGMLNPFATLETSAGICTVAARTVSIYGKVSPWVRFPSFNAIPLVAP